MPPNVQWGSPRSITVYRAGSTSWIRRWRQLARRLHASMHPACVFEKKPSRVRPLQHSVLQGFEIGSGFSGAAMTGSEHNDEFEMRAGRVRTRTNRSGGVQGAYLLGP